MPRQLLFIFFSVPLFPCYSSLLLCYIEEDNNEKEFFILSLYQGIKNRPTRTRLGPIRVHPLT